MLIYFYICKDFILKHYKTILLSLAVVIAAAIAILCLVKKPNSSPTGVSEPVSTSSQSLQASSVVSEEKEIGLVITSPKSADITTTEPSVVFTGSSDPAESLIVNGKEVERDAGGLFSLSFDLQTGNNTFKFEHKGQAVEYKVRYRYVVINSYTPKGEQSFSSGTTLVVDVSARNGSTVTASLNGTNVTLVKKKAVQTEEGEASSDTFIDYSSSFQLPSGNSTNLYFGKIKFTATYNGITETFYSGNITVKKSSIIHSSDPAVTPKGGNYLDVGSGLIATIVRYKAETFNGNSTDDLSRPTNNYLPEGTMDYCAEGLVTNGKYKYYKLRCGRRIYETCSPGTSYASTVATTSVGTLPDHNEISVSSFVSEGQYSVLKLDCLWKAPFYFDLLNQSYINPTVQDYSITNVTFSYVDITFCYATAFSGQVEIPANHPVFSSAEIIKNNYDYTLRLRLKKTGGFYGWDCYYDADGKLTFEFLNPAKMQNENSLEGIRVYVNIGHGGYDPGAPGFNSTNTEAERNLYLGKLIKDKLTALGATVIMSRETNIYLTPDQQALSLRAADADFCVAIHHDSNPSSSPNGFAAFHFNPFSKTAADFITTRTSNASIYQKIWAVRSHYFFLMKNPNCPVVLTENGFMSNRTDFNNIISAEKSDKKAQAIVNGILDYFRSIQ